MDTGAWEESGSKQGSVWSVQFREKRGPTEAEQSCEARDGKHGSCPVLESQQMLGTEERHKGNCMLFVQYPPMSS